MNRSFTTRQLSRRQNTILGAFQTGAAKPTSEIIRELAEITEALADEPVRKHDNVVARLTVKRANGRRTIVEVYADASFHSFFHFFVQEGNRRSTRQSLRTASRNEGIFLGNFGLGAIEEKLCHFGNKTNPVVSSKLRILKKRAYKRLLTISPDQLGMLKIETRPWKPQMLFSPLGAGRGS